MFVRPWRHILPMPDLWSHSFPWHSRPLLWLCSWKWWSLPHEGYGWYSFSAVTFSWKVTFQSDLGAGQSAVWLRTRVVEMTFPRTGCPGAQMGAQVLDMGQPASCWNVQRPDHGCSHSGTGVSSSHCLQNGHSRSARRQEFICRREDHPEVHLAHSCWLRKAKCKCLMLELMKWHAFRMRGSLHQSPCEEAASFWRFSSSYKKFIVKTENYVCFNFTVKTVRIMHSLGHKLFPVLVFSSCRQAVRRRHPGRQVIHFELK